MIRSKVSAQLGGIALDTLDGRIYLSEVRELAPKIKLSTSSVPMGGLRLTRREQQSRSVALRFIIWEKDKIERGRVLRKIAAWAEGGGWLGISGRDAQRLSVVCEKLPELSTKAWDGEMEMSFISYAPSWESMDAIHATAALQADVEKELILRPDGTAKETPLCLEITCQSGVLHSLRTRLGSQEIALSGLSLTAGQKLTISEEGGLTRILAGGQSALANRSATSADSIRLLQREGNRVQLLADAPAAVIAKAWAKWI